MPHPIDKYLQQFVAGKLDAEEEKNIENHLAQCRVCMKRVSELERTPLDILMQRVKAAESVSDDSDPNETTDLSEHSHGQYRSPPSCSLISGDILGTTLRLEEKVGRGSMGEAWKAYDLTADRYVVLKFVPSEMLHLPEATASVRSSFQKIHALQHQHICPVYSLIADPKLGLYTVMKYIDGVTLRDYRRQFMEKKAEIPFDEIIQILWAIAKGLDYAHEKKVIHRDIKPANIMIGKEEGVQIIDFGLAGKIQTSISQTADVVSMSSSGTRLYMAPEQWRGEIQDARTDQYALAVTAYELFAGHPPFPTDNIQFLWECVRDVLPEPIPGLPEHINAALIKAMAKNREDRFPDCKSFIGALKDETVKVGALAVAALQVDDLKVNEINVGTLKVGAMENSTSQYSLPHWFINLCAIAICTILSGLFGFATLFALAQFMQPKQTPPQPQIAIAASPEKPRTSNLVDQSIPIESRHPDEKTFASAPPEFLKQLKETEDKIKKEDDFTVAGQVFIDGTPVETATDFAVYLDHHPCYHFKNGWFVFQVLPFSKIRDKTIRAYGIQTDQTKMSTTILPGKVNFIKVELHKAPDDRLIDLTGKILWENGKPVENIPVEAHYSWAGNYGSDNLLYFKGVTTDHEGKYRFPKVFPHGWTVATFCSTLNVSAYATTETGAETVEDIVILQPRKIIIDTVYQPDGSTDFTKDNVITGRYELITNSRKLAMGDHKTGGKIVFDPTAKKNRYDYYEDDLSLHVKSGQIFFSHFHTGGKSGHYALGKVDFESVNRADPDKIQKYHSPDSPCESGHVYIVRTYQKGHYVKFVVRSIETLEPKTVVSVRISR